MLLPAAVALINLAPSLPDGLVGSDTYPILLTSGYHSPGELLDVLRSRLMPDFFPVDFYRPVAGAVWGAGRALWGLAPRPWLLLLLLIHAVNVTLIARIGPLLLEERGRAIGFLAALLLALHPLTPETVPVVSRLPDLLGGTLVLLVLLLRGGEARGAGRARAAGALLLALLAYGTKEGTYFLPALLFGFAMLRGRGPGRALRESIPYAAALLLFLALRRSVLGGIGGYGEEGAGTFHALSTAGAFLSALAAPFGPGETAAANGGADFGLRAAFALLLAILWTATTGRRADEPVAGTRRRAILFLLLWIGLVVAVHLPVRRFSHRYAYLGLLPTCLLFAAIALGRVRSTAGRVLSALFVVLLFWNGTFAPLFGGYREWKVGAREAGVFLDNAARAIEAEPGRTRFFFSGCPWKVSLLRARTPHIQQAYILSSRSVRAWAALRFPEREMRIEVDRVRIEIEEVGGGAILHRKPVGPVRPDEAEENGDGRGGGS